MEFKPESDNFIDQQLHRTEYMRTEKTKRRGQMNDFFLLKEGKVLHWHLEFLHSNLNLSTFANESRLEKTKELKFCWVSPSLPLTPNTNIDRVLLLSSYIGLLQKTHKYLYTLLKLWSCFFWYGSKYLFLFFLVGTFEAEVFPFFTSKWHKWMMFGAKVLRLFFQRMRNKQKFLLGARNIRK